MGGAILITMGMYSGGPMGGGMYSGDPMGGGMYSGGPMGGGTYWWSHGWGYVSWCHGLMGGGMYSGGWDYTDLVTILPTSILGMYSAGPVIIHLSPGNL